MTEYANLVRIQLREYKANDLGHLVSTKKGVSLTADIWFCLTAQPSHLGQPLYTNDLTILLAHLMLSTIFIENKPYVTY